MAKRSFAPNGAAVKQRDTLVFSGTWQAADTITLTIDNVTLVITVGTVTAAADIALLVYEAFTGATAFTDVTSTMIPQAGGTAIPQFNEIDCARSSATLTFTSKTAGVPFTLGASRTTGATGAISYTAGVVAATGSTFFSQQDNWTGNTVPVDADDIVFEQSDVDCSDGLEPAIQPGEFQHHMTYTGFIGRKQRNDNNASQVYSDYRTKALTFDDNASGTGVYKLGMGSGKGARGIRLNFGAGKSLVTVLKSGAASNNIPNILLQGTNADNALTNLSGSVGVSFYAGEAMTLVSLTNGQGEQSNAETICGPDATLDSCTVNVVSGKLTTNSEIDELNIFGSSAQMFHNKGDIATLNLYKGSLVIGDALTVTAAYIDGYLDLSQTSGTITFTNCEFGPNAVVYAPAGNVAFTNPYTQGAYSEKRKLNLGPNRTFDVA
jgi:hypothetical protein